MNQQVTKLSEELLEARRRGDRSAMIAIGGRLRPLLRKAHWEAPEVFSNRAVREAKGIVRHLVVAMYIEPPRNLLVRG